jgi:GNAT superfamily N-acetyltransferase
MITKRILILPTKKREEEQIMSQVKLKMILDIKPQLILDKYDTKFIYSKDIFELGAAMKDAFIGTPDYVGETLEELIEEINDVVNEGFSPLIKEASYRIEYNGITASAIMISLYQGLPLVSEIFTTKAYLGKGLASFLLRKSIHSLYIEGYQKLILYVHPSNERAISIYENLGFRGEQ